MTHHHKWLPRATSTLLVTIACSAPWRDSGARRSRCRLDLFAPTSF